MRVVVALILSVCVSNAFAKDDKQQQAEAKFAAMSAQEAFASGFKQQIMNIQMPGTSTWMKPTDLCTDGTSVRTENPVGYCVQWTGKNDDGKSVTVNSYWEAKDLFDTNPASLCSDQDYQILSTKINYTDTKCALWSAKGGDDEDFKTATFSSKSKAEDYGGNAKCVQSQIYTAKFPTAFEVKFYRNSVENNRYLGSHVYAIARCGDAGSF